MLTLKNQRIHLTPKVEDIHGFSSKVAAVACFLEANNKLLLLKTDNPNKFQDQVWGVPGGKIENGETPEHAVVRELFEESGIKLDDTDLKFVMKLYVRAENLDYDFFVYRASINSAPESMNIMIDSKEHSDYKWLVPKDALDMDLILGEKELISFIFLQNEASDDNQ